MAADFAASTNEPFWTVTVSGKAMTLAGIGVTRELVVQSNDAMFDGRNVVATDAQDQIEVRVTPRACRNSMAGDSFPCTARLTIDGGTPVLGCVRAMMAARTPSHGATLAPLRPVPASSRRPGSC